MRQVECVLSQVVSHCASPGAWIQEGQGASENHRHFIGSSVGMVECFHCPMSKEEWY